jgi:hypothetical protein
MARESKSHGVTCNPPGGIGHSSSARRGGWCRWTLVIGFTWGGWVTGGTAREKAQKDVSTALVSALSPVCVDNYFCFDPWYFHASILCSFCRLSDNRSNDI